MDLILTEYVGFGGANVHVIVESFNRLPSTRSRGKPMLNSPASSLLTPFVFSGVSKHALATTLESYATFLIKRNNDLNLCDLAWILQHERSHFAFRYAVTGSDFDDLVKTLQSTVQAFRDGNNSDVFTKAQPQSQPTSKPTKPNILGIFTGQGAQWATMGRDLINRSPFAQDVLAKLDAALAALPEADRPYWTLKEELTIQHQRSKVNSSALAQPLTTALQIILVDLAAVAGLRLCTIVGHSSGEIAAAYAAGIIKAEDAIRIAYYRGTHSRLACGINNQQGGMLATSLTPEKATEFCHHSKYRGHLTIAACNSPSSVTISGDADAILEAIIDLEAEDIFARKLQVDKAYHSQHMIPCIEPYLQSLKDLNIELRPTTPDSPLWLSSTFPGIQLESFDYLKSSYWTENLSKPVHFSTAISAALSKQGIPDIVIEFGPHSTFEKPVQQIMETITQLDPLYIAFLRRGVSALTTIPDALGRIWCKFGRDAVNFANVDQALSNATRPHHFLLNDLPPYPWRHDKEYWSENRFLRRRLQETGPPAELLGKRFDVGACHEAKWRCFLSPNDIPWLRNHKLNGVAVLPGAAYVSMVSTATQRIFEGYSIEMIEIENLSFKCPITFPDNDAKAEIILSIANIERSNSQARANFFVDFCHASRNEDLETASSGKITIRFGFDADRAYPESLPQPFDLTRVDPERFYKHLLAKGYGYYEAFRSIQKLSRKMNFATGEIALTESDLIIHPATLDCLFQAAFAAESYPGDSALRTILVPTNIRSIKVFPIRCREVLRLPQKALQSDEEAFSCNKSRTDFLQETASGLIDSNSHAASPKTPALRFELGRTASSEFSGVLEGTSEQGVICQVDGLTTKPYQISTSNDDIAMFKETVWMPSSPLCVLSRFSQTLSKEEQQLLLHCERVSLYYIRKLNEDVTMSEERNAPPAVRHLLEYARMTLVEVSLGIHPHIDKEWLNDDKDTVATIVKYHPTSSDLKCVERMGKAYPAIIAGKETAIDVLLGERLLHEFYCHGLGLPSMNNLVATFLETLSCCASTIKILEVGGGTGSTTESILERISRCSYVFTDISSGFLGPVKEKLKAYADRLSFRTFDMERDPDEQEFTLESFDIIVASNVLHASADVKSVLQRLRSLLRPGGHLVALELNPGNFLWTTVGMGGLPGWWLGHGEDRFWSPALSEEKWHQYLKETGFAGIDAITPAVNALTSPYRTFCSQAIDERVMSLRDPLTSNHFKRQHSLLILGADPVNSPGLLVETKDLLAASFEDILILDSLDNFSSTTRMPHAVLSLLELNESVLHHLSLERWSALQRLFHEATDVFWVTRGATQPINSQDSYMNMTMGLGRALRNELPHLRLTFLDVNHDSAITAKCLAEGMLRWYTLGQWTANGQRDDTLFPQHTEIAMQGDLMLVPTVRNSEECNNRYNSQHRQMIEELSPSSRPLELVHVPHGSNGYYMLQIVPPEPNQAAKGLTRLISILRTTFYAINVKGAGNVFFGIGSRSNGERVITASKATRSFLPESRILRHFYNGAETTPECYLQELAAQVVADRVIGAASSLGSMVVICTDRHWTSALKIQAERRGKRVVIITGQEKTEIGGSTFIHCDNLACNIRQKLPTEISLVANLSIHPDDRNLFRRLGSILCSEHTKMRNNDAFFTAHPTAHPLLRGSVHEETTPAAHRGRQQVLSAFPCDTGNPSSISPRQALNQAVHSLSTVVDWTLEEKLPVNVLPAPKMVNLSSTKTYLLIGTSDIAQSICEWMVERGARYLALASRNPHHLINWATRMEAKGTVIHIGVMDVSSESSVRDFITATRKANMPHIGGLVHLGLVLRDAAFPNMSFEDFQAVVDVKANGSLNLHEQLKHEQLDFFVLISSISYVSGSPGQSNYAAGNAFMAGLMKYRRSIGLPASVVHLGCVIGIGYILHKANDKARKLHDEDLQSKGFYPVSERDIHQILAEAILASPATSGVNPEIITGLRGSDSKNLDQIPWLQLPMFAHVLENANTVVPQKLQQTLTVQQKLEQEGSITSPSVEKIYDVIKTALVEKLCMLLQMDEVDEEKSLVELGIDSLVSAEIGSWARKELKVQIPNSLIFNGGNVGDLSKYAADHLDRSVVGLDGRDGGTLLTDE